MAHTRVGLCSICYKEKRKQDWASNEQRRLSDDPQRCEIRLAYQKKMYIEQYRQNRIINKSCRCGQKALKGSRFSLCRGCSKKHSQNRRIRYQNNRKKSHLATKLRENIKSRFKQSFGTKSGSIVNYLGCSIDAYKAYLESRFQLGMSWENYGKWHIDHIIPLSSNYSDLNLHHYTNTQSLWKEDHVRKTRQENGSKMSSQTD